MSNKNYNRIKIVLAEKNIPNKYLAEKLGRDQATISKWVTNSAQPPLETLIQIAQCLDVDVKNSFVFQSIIHLRIESFKTNKEAFAFGDN